jgi:hypothetical protein
MSRASSHNRLNSRETVRIGEWWWPLQSCPMSPQLMDNQEVRAPQPDHGGRRKAAKLHDDPKVSSSSAILSFCDWCTAARSHHQRYQAPQHLQSAQSSQIGWFRAPQALIRTQQPDRKHPRARAPQPRHGDWCMMAATSHDAKWYDAPQRYQSAHSSQIEWFATQEICQAN